MASNKSRYIIGVVCFIALLFVVCGIVVVTRVVTPERILTSAFVERQVQQQLSKEDMIEHDVFAYLPSLLGFDTPKTYLLLFLNNTELRPGGGFIGSYAVVQFDRGRPSILVVEGTELLDKRTPDTWRPVPPLPITKELGVDRWYFRDSNWSPDFRVSSEQALLFYEKEGGLFASDIDGVIGVTPTVLERFMSLVGPLTVDGISFTADTFIETLEYEVEFGYAARGLDVTERKDIISHVFHALLKKTEKKLLTNMSSYFPLIVGLLQEKHIALFFQDESLQNVFHTQGWTGEITPADTDYLLWVDANLAALKTDHAIKRNLQYTVRPIDQRYEATATMTYMHTGQFDWRTTRYRTYGRVFVPEGSTVRSIKLFDGKKETILSPDMIDTGVEYGRTWFGFFYVIEPQQTGTVTVTYDLPSRLYPLFTHAGYQLLVQKQIGTTAHGLTLDIEFGTTIVAADPSELKENWGDMRYQITTNIEKDRLFSVTTP